MSNSAQLGCICGDLACTIPYGYCHCKCGEKVKIAYRTRKDTGWKRGEPMKFIDGHNSIKRFFTFQPNDPSIRFIPLTRNQIATVDVADYEWLNQWKWFAKWNKRTRSFYAARCVPRESGRQAVIYMHRQILGLEVGDPRKGDHKNTGETLDNRRFNLRIATQEQQMHNTRRQWNNSTGYKGVTYDKATKKWVAQIRINKSHRYLGSFATPELAYNAYCEAAREHRGEFARLA